MKQEKIFRGTDFSRASAPITPTGSSNHNTRFIPNGMLTFNTKMFHHLLSTSY